MESEIDESLWDHKFFGVVLAKIKDLDEIFKPILKNLLNELNSATIDIRKIRENGYLILNEIPSLRSLVWKLLLSYLPPNVKEWESHVDKKRNEYTELKEKYMSAIGAKKEKKRKSIDHPLSNDGDSHWKDFFMENRLSSVIDKDLNRTRADIPFFKEKSKANKNETNLDVLKRILIIFAKKQKEVKYVQGFNEILAVIYYCFAQDANPYFYLELEADVYFCFENLINQFQDLFIQEKDFTETGIKSRINYLKYLLEQTDYELFAHLNNMHIDITIFIFRWYTLFFSQEFSLANTMKVMDYILFQGNKFHYLNVLCLAAIKIKRDKLLKNDYSVIMDSMQQFIEEDANKMFSRVQDIDKYLNDNQNKLDYISFVHSPQNAPF